MTHVLVKTDKSVVIKCDSGHEIAVCPCCDKPFTVESAAIVLTNLTHVFGEHIPDNGLQLIVDIMGSTR